MSRAGLYPALALLAGAVIGCRTTVQPWPARLVLGVACVIAIVAWRHGRSLCVVGALVAGMTAAGVSLAADARDRALHTSARTRLDRSFGGFLIESLGPAGRHDPVPTRLRLTEDAAARDGFIALRGSLIALWLDGAWQPVDGGVFVSVNGLQAAQRQLDWRAGRMLEAPMTFRRPARYLNDGVEDFEQDQALGGVTLLATVKSALLVTVVARGHAFAELSADIRAYIRRSVASWIGPHSAISAGIALAVLIGDRTGLSDDTREKLQAAGTYHVTAISGGNIAILAAVITMVLLAVGIRGPRASLVTLVLLTLYAFAINSGPSVWRATVMAILFLAARAMDHRSAPWQTISVAAAVMVVAAPLDVLDSGFVLTFGATVALLEGVRAGSQAGGSRVINWIAVTTLASAAVELALLPISARLFSRVTAAGLALNLLAVPLMAVLQVATIVVATVSQWPTIAAIAGYVAHLAASALVASADLVTVAPWLNARVPPPGIWLMAIYYAGLAAAKASPSRVLRTVGVFALASAGLAIVLGVEPTRLALFRPSPGVLRVTMVDVGQGEATLIETIGGKGVLVDAGGSPFGGSQVGQRVLVPALWARRVRSLDTLLLTHGDPDHIGGALDVVHAFRVRQLVTGVPVATHAPILELEQSARRLGVPVTSWTTGGRYAIDGLDLRVLNPPVPDWERRRVRNDDSVVVEVVYGDVAILMTGDISAEVERAIAPHLSRTKTRVLKVAHHGSRTSSSRELLESWRPQLALISVGRGNTFGHPAPEVIQRLRAIGATVLRTDRDGEITLESDGREVWWTVFRAGSGL